MEIQSSYKSRKLPTSDSRRRDGLRLREGSQRRVESSWSTACNRRGPRISWPKARAREIQSSIVMPDMGTKGTTSTAPIRGCSPLWCLRSMSSIAFWLAARAASFTGPGAPTKLITDRLWSGLDSTSRSVTPGVFLIASAIDSITSFLWPSLKLGTHSTNGNLDASQSSSCQLVSLIVKRAREARSCDRLVSRNLLENRTLHESFFPRPHVRTSIYRPPTSLQREARR